MKTDIRRHNRQGGDNKSLIIDDQRKAAKSPFHEVVIDNAKFSKREEITKLLSNYYSVICQYCPTGD